MAHPLEAATLAVVKEQEGLKKQVVALTEQLRVLEDEKTQQVRILESELDKREGEINEMLRQLQTSNEQRDHYMRCWVESTKTIQNIDMFVQDAMNKARIEIEKRTTESADKVRQITDDMRQEASVDMNALENKIVQQQNGTKRSDKPAKSLDKAEPVI